MQSLTTRRFLLSICIAALLVSAVAVASAGTKKNILVVSVTKGFRHSAIPTGEEVIRKLGQDSGLWTTDFARTDEEIVQKMTPDGLKKYNAIVFNNTTGDLPLPDRQAFIDWVKAGGGIFGIHAATDTYHNWTEFTDMMGGEFKTHGAQSEVEFLVLDPKHPSTKGLPRSFKSTEEIYQFNTRMGNILTDKIRVLIALDKHPNTGAPGFYPISWVRSYGKGRVFYTAIGHREDLMTSDTVQKHYLGGMKWVLGLEKGSSKPIKPASWISASEKREGFRALPNSPDLKGWHYRDEGRTPWTVENGWLVMGQGGANIITDEKFDDFILRYEYMIPGGGNSGVYLRGRYEIQVLDDTGITEPETHSNGSIYGRIAPGKLASLPPGQWQTVEATLIGNRVTVILNGVKIIDNQQIEGVTGAALDDKIDEPGPIMLQGDHSPVAYRNIRIKELK